MTPYVRRTASAVALALLLSACEIAPATWTAPTHLSYAGLPSTLTPGQALAPVAPTLTGHADLFTVAPPLPAGLALDARTGVLSGTPTGHAARSGYRIAAANFAGETATVVTFAVGAAPLVAAGYLGALYQPVLWPAGSTRVDLGPAGVDGKAYAVAAVGGKLYAGGYRWDSASSSDVPCVWIDGAPTDLAAVPGQDAYVRDVAVSQGVVYAAGYYWTAANYANACYWAGGDLVTLPVDSTRAKSVRAWAVAVDDNHVYTGGSWVDQAASGNLKPTVPCYWIDSTRVDLPVGPGSTYADLFAVDVDQGVVYAGGYYSDPTRSNLRVPCYWQGTTRVDLDANGSDAYVEALDVGGGHVAAAGYWRDGSVYVPAYWLDGVRTDLAGDGVHSAEAYAVSLSGGQVTVGGAWYDGGKWTACLWSAGTRTDLADDGVHDSRVYDLTRD